MDEWPTLVKNAVAALVIILAISVVFLLVYFGLNIANRGAQRLSDSTGTLDRRTFDQYDQQIVSGTAVLGAINNFRGQPYAIIVQTNRNSNTTASNYSAWLGQPGTTEAPAPATWFTKTVTGLASIPAAGVPWTQPFFYMPSGVYSAANPNPPTHILTGWMVYPDYQNMDTGAATTRANVHYINTTGRFKSVLIYAINDEIIGVFFEQSDGTAPAFGNKKLGP